MPTTFVELVADNYKVSIRKIGDYEAKRSLYVLLPIIAKQYGGRETLEGHLLKECTKLIVDRFSFLGVEEVQEAYRQWAAGEFKLKGGEMYGGVFTVRQLGMVLAAYNENRKKVVGELLRLSEKQIERNQEEARAERLRQKFEKEFPQMLMNAKTKITDWQEIPDYWYQAALKRGFFQLDRTEALEIFKEAEQLHTIGRWKGKPRKVFKESTIIRPKRNFNAEIQVIARKLTVFRKIINNPDLKIAV